MFIESMNCRLYWKLEVKAPGIYRGISTEKKNQTATDLKAFFAKPICDHYELHKYMLLFLSEVRRLKIGIQCSLHFEVLSKTFKF